jgi:hypothetical protein
MREGFMSEMYISEPFSIADAFVTEIGRIDELAQKL